MRFSGLFIQLFQRLSFYRAEQAYKSADCPTAVNRFEALLTSGYLSKGSDAAAKAAAYQAECECITCSL